jgi:arylsulfatase A-like enzyme
MGANILEFESTAYRCHLYDKDERKHFFPGYRVDAMADHAVDFVHRNANRPFFLFLSFLEPHHQNNLDAYPAPRGYRERLNNPWMPPDLAEYGGSTNRHLNGYYGMVKRFDKALGRIRDALISLDLEDDTILLFVSDHGSHFKTRNGEYKRSCHEGSVHVPCAAIGPGFTSG